MQSIEVLISIFGISEKHNATPATHTHTYTYIYKIQKKLQLKLESDAFNQLYLIEINNRHFY